MESLARRYPDTDQVTLEMDDLNTHAPGSFYETFFRAAGKALWGRLEFVYTPKHGSCLNVAEIEMNVFVLQGLARRIDSLDNMGGETGAWQERRNHAKSLSDCQFTGEDVRIELKLKQLCPTLEARQDRRSERSLLTQMFAGFPRAEISRKAGAVHVNGPKWVP